jgi:heat shock protein HslJ
MKSKYLLLAAIATGLLGCAAPSSQSDRPVAEPPAFLSVEMLVGSDWLAEVIDGVPVVNAPQPRLRWLDESRISGSGGCNQFVGRSNLAFDRMILGPLAATRMACVAAPQGQEDKFFKALELTRRARLSEGGLVLSDDGGKTLLRLVRSSK